MRAKTENNIYTAKKYVIMLWISALIAFIVLVIGSITDFQKREVHDYVSYSLIFVGFGASIIYSIITGTFYILQTVMGFGIGVGLAYAMFYLGQWGGGDSKLLMGLGAVFGFNIFNIYNIFGEKNLLFMLFLINVIIAGAAYGLVFSIYLAIKHRKQFIKNIKIWAEKKEIKIARIILLTFTIVSALIIILFIPQDYKLVFLSIIALLFFIFYIWLFVKIIEESCMIKMIDVSKLTEGDWIYEDIYIGKKYITGPKDLGISKKQIAILKKSKKIKQVLIKEGIPFIPAFLIAFILTVAMYYLRIPGILF
jgi:Flp pilus assembly protein protease CpaA